MLVSTKQSEPQPMLSTVEIQGYRGKWVAFAVDGSQILASGDDEIEADAQAQSLGFSPADYVLEAIPAVDTLLL